LEKHQNKYRINILKKIALLFISLISLNITAQTTNELDYSSPKSYEIGGIMVNGADHLNNSTLISISGLEIGETSEFQGIIYQLQLQNYGSKGFLLMLQLQLIKL